MRPPEVLEALVAILIPASRREEVLGDLYERYTSPLRYLAGALGTVPFVIVSQVRRTTDVQLRLTEALLLYALFIAAAWGTGGAIAIAQMGLLRLALPVVVVLSVLMLEDAWALPANRSQLREVWSVAIAVGCTCVCLVPMLPLSINLLGSGASLFLVSGLRMLFAAGTRLPESARGMSPRPSRKPKAIALSGSAMLAAEIMGAILIISLAAASVRYLPEFRKPVFAVVVLVAVVYHLKRRV